MPKGKAQVAIKNAVTNGDNVLELYFLDYIYDQAYYDWYYGVIEYSVVQDTINQVRAANPSKVKLIIDSEGGDATIGLALYNYLRSQPVKVEVEILGMAGSIASVIAQCASKGKRLIARNAFMVIHKAWGGATGNSDDLREAADVVDMYTAQIVDIYALNNTAGLSAEDIAALIADGDYWMTGEEAVAQGFADATFNDNANFSVAARIQTIDARYHNVPAALKALPAPAATITPAATEDTPETGTSQEPAAPEATEPPKQKPGNIANTVKSTVVKFNELVRACIGGIKAKVIKKDADNLAEEIANEIGAPLTELAAAMQAQTEEAIAEAETRVTNEVVGPLIERIEKMEKLNAKLLKENEELTTEAAETEGAPAKTGAPAAAVANPADWSTSATVYKAGAAASN